MRSQDDHRTILRLWDEGHNKLQIARMTGFPRGTIHDCITRYGSSEGLKHALIDPELDTARTVLTLWEQGASQLEISRQTGLSRYRISQTIDQYRSIRTAAGDEKPVETTRTNHYRPYKRKSAYTDTELREAVRASYSIRQTLLYLGVKPAGGNYQIIKKRIKTLALDTSHFRGQGWSHGKTHQHAPKYDLDDILVKDSSYTTTSHLKKRLISEGYLEPRCAACDLTEWRDQPIPLELDHINGDRRDHRLDNLRLLCPNCHALTPTYRGRNIGTTV